MNAISERPFPLEVLETVENLIRYYLIRRRKTVIQAMLELRPSIVIGLRVEGIVGIREIPAYHRFYEEKHAHRDTLFTGIWRDVWDFRLHGYGCKLVHRQTKEGFDWDLSEPDRFYIHEFQEHLHWRIRNDRDGNVENYLRWWSLVEVEGLKAIFFELVKQDKLEYIKLEAEYAERERLPAGDWKLERINFDIPEHWA